AARSRVEQHFRIDQTIAPLVQLLQKTCSRRPAGDAHASPRDAATVAATAAGEIAYLIDRWPDGELPMLDREIEEMRNRNVPILPIVCEFDATTRLTSAKKRGATHLEFLPDAVVIEAEWQANPALAQKLEETRAGQSARPAATIFLRQA